MDSVDSNGGSSLVVTELSQIKELLRQLEVHLGGSPDLCKHLASQIFSITERTIVMITSSNLDGRKRPAADAGLTSPPSAMPTPSPLSDITDVPLKSTKKRKMTGKGKHQVRVISAGGGENPVDDGHSWRKYGQKEILGAKHQRAYYRCTHRHSQGCAATKQVQRTDEDPTLFDVIYHGTHTCLHKTAAVGPVLSASLTVKTEELAAAAEPQCWSATAPFCFSSTPLSGFLAPEHSPFSAPSTLENWRVSPGTSGSYHVASFRPFEAAGDAEWREQFELQEVVSALVAAMSAPAPSVDMPDEFLDMYISSFFK